MESLILNPLTPNDHYSCRTAPLTSKRRILYIYSTNIGTAYFKYGIYSVFFPLQNAVCFIILTYLVPVLFIFYIQGVLKLKKNNSGTKRLIVLSLGLPVKYDLPLSAVFTCLSSTFATFTITTFDGIHIALSCITHILNLCSAAYKVSYLVLSVLCRSGEP